MARDFHPAKNIVQTFFEAVAHRVGLLIDRLTGDDFQAGGTGHRRKRVAVEGAWVIDAMLVVPFRVAPMRYHVNNVGLATHRTTGQCPGDYLGHGGQIRGYPVADLRSTRRGPKPGHHLVEYQHHSMLLGKLPQTFQVIRDIKGKLAVVRPSGFQNQCRDV